LNWANVVTIGRIALIPVFVYFMYAGEVRDGEAATRLGPWVAIVVFALAAVSDSLDGYLARRYERITALGQFLDPLADKLLVGAALVTLVMLRGFPAWAAIIIVVREIAVSMLRSAALRRGRSMPASWSGKLKTATQIPTVMLWLLPRSGWVAPVQDAAVVVAVALTVISGVQYFARSKSLLAPRDVIAG
jgi:CDP-diacylglycerol--glycerol-3-phosphate 3-phosphatidyltransferase